MPDINNAVVPFGKYRGQPVEALAADQAYCEWLTAQPWFRDRFTNLYTIVVNNFTTPTTDTPEHNALQVQFLDPAICTAVARALDFYRECKLVGFETDGWDVRLKTSEPCFWEDYDSYKGKRKQREGWSDVDIWIELKPSMGDDYPTVLRQMQTNRRRVGREWGGKGVLIIGSFCADGASLDQVKAIFATSEFHLLLIDDIVPQETI